MKKYLPYLPYIFNTALVFIGIICPYYNQNIYNYYENHEIIFFLLVSSIFVIILNLCIKIKVRHWVFSSLIFYLTVLTVFLLGNQWKLDTVNIFAPFQIQHHSSKHNDPLPRLLEFNYPIGILFLSILNLFTQLISLLIANLIKAIINFIKFCFNNIIK